MIDKLTVDRFSYIQTMIVPVPYTDFEKGYVEDLITPFIENDSVDMIMSLSLNGGAYYFDLERFAAKNRGGFHDNMNIGTFPSVPRLDTEKFNPNIGLGAEFYHTTLPAIKIITSLITNNFNLNLQKYFYDQSYKASNARPHPVDDNTQPNTNSDSFNISEIQGSSKDGSGGSYLSNEIFYRIARVRENAGSSIMTGHFHLANPDGSPPISITPFSLNEIITETKNSIIRCLEIL